MDLVGECSNAREGMADCMRFDVLEGGHQLDHVMLSNSSDLGNGSNVVDFVLLQVEGTPTA